MRFANRVVSAHSTGFCGFAVARGFFASPYAAPAFCLMCFAFRLMAFPPGLLPKPSVFPKQRSLVGPVIDHTCRTATR